MSSRVTRRKQEHLDLCANEDVEARRTTLLEEVQLFHDALPELAVAEIDLSVDILGRTLGAPLLISGMTGGTDRAEELNQAFATVAQKYGLALGVGSQRAMWTDPETAQSYRVRDAAPDALLFGNVGAVQARDLGVAAVGELVEAIGADALCVHLNVAQELVQDEGDRDFRGCLDAIGQLVAELPVAVVPKETGCGFSPATLERLFRLGVRTVDVAGAGGTTWPGVEGLRGSERQRALGAELREWGIPTAASLIFARRAGMATIASGGLRGAGDVVAGLALGGHIAGMALPYLREFEAGGVAGVSRFVDQLIDAIRARLLLVGAANTRALRGVPRELGPELRRWTAWA